MLNVKRRYFALASAGAVVLGGLALAAPAAHAAPVLSVTLSSCGSGSSAVWDASGNPVLTIGTAPAATCGAPAGSTYNPAFAQVGINGVSGQPVPTSEPVFVTDHYNSGSPRIVIELNNGKSLVGYPALSGLNGTDMAWAVGNSGTYTDYATAYAAANANTTTVKDAFIVEDTDQVQGTADTITGLQYGGNTLPAGADVVTVAQPVSQSSTAGTADHLQLSASSSKGDGIASFSASGLPHGLTLNSSTGLISGTPDTPGNNVVTVHATDNGGTVSAGVSFAWNVQAQATPPPVTVSNVVNVRNRLSGKCLNYGGARGMEQYACGTFASEKFVVVTFSDGSKHLKSVPEGKYVADGAKGVQLFLTSTPARVTLVNGGIFRFGNGLVMDDKGQNKSNFAKVIGWTYNGGNNQRWDFQNAPA